MIIEILVTLFMILCTAAILYCNGEVTNELLNLKLEVELIRKEIQGECKCKENR